MPTPSDKVRVRKRYGWWEIICPDEFCEPEHHGAFYSMEEAFRWAESHATIVHGEAPNA
jgi:hypothetical protein